MGRFNPDFMDSLGCMSFAIGMANLQQNLQQSKNNDIIDQIGTKTETMLSILEKDLQQQNTILYQQNEMLQDILKRIQKLQKEQKNDSRGNFQEIGNSYDSRSNDS